MAWVAPVTRSTGTLITASIWNADIVANTLALKDPPTDSSVINEVADYTLTTTSFVDVDATDLAVSITTTGGAVLVHFHGSVRHSANGGGIFFDLTVDAARSAGDDGLAMAAADANGVIVTTPSFTRLIEGLAAGTHDFVLQWRTTAATATLFAGAGTSNRDVHPQFWAREVS